MLTWQTAIVNPQMSRSLYQHALAILRSVIEHGDYRAAHRAVIALGPALSGLSKGELDSLHHEREDDVVSQARECMRDALAVLHFAVEKHSHWLVRLAANRELTQQTCWGHDRIIVAEFRKALSKLHGEDIEFRTALNMVGGWNDEAKNAWEVISPDQFVSAREEAERQWRQRAAVLVTELCERFPIPREFASHIQGIVVSLHDTAMHPQPRRLLRVMGEVRPQPARGLIDWLLTHPQHELAYHWPFLMKSNPGISEAERAQLLRTAISQPGSDARLAAVEEIMRWPRGAAPDDLSRAALRAAAPSFTAHELVELLLALELSPPPGAEWAWEIFYAVHMDGMPVALAPRLLSAIIPDPMGWHAAPAEAVYRVLRWLEPLPEIPRASNGASIATLCRTHPRAVFDFLCHRLEKAGQMGPDVEFEPVPHGYPRQALPLGALNDEADYPAICRLLESNAMKPTSVYACHRGWVLLYQSVVLLHPEIWKQRSLQRIVAAPDMKVLATELELLSGNGSRLIFDHPDISRAFLLRAEELGGTKEKDRMRFDLYLASSPESRSWSGGTLDPEHDYLQSGALAAAKQYETDTVLGPFYRWIVGQEQQDKRWNREQYALDIAQLDEEDDS